MDPRVRPLADLLRLNTRLLRNCCDGVDNERAAARPVAAANSMSFLVAHLIDARYMLVRLAGGSVANPVGHLPDATGIDDVGPLPSIAELLEGWTAISTALDEALAGLTDETLSAASPQRFPVDDGTVLGAIAFLVQHDSYHIGQLSLLRRAHGLPAMSYSRTGLAR